MSQLITLFTRMRQSFPSRIMLPIFAGVLLIAPLMGVLTFLATHSLTLGALAERVSAFQAGQGGISSQGIGTREQPGCQGANCTGQDPIKEGCAADATTPESVPLVYDGSDILHLTPDITIQPGEHIGRLDLRYSFRCQAYWARAFSFVPSETVEPSGVAGITDNVRMTLSYGPDQQLLDPKFPFDPMLSIYSDMTPTPEPAMVTMTLFDAAGRQFPVTVTL
jgi:hypothetical protein